MAHLYFLTQMGHYFTHDDTTFGCDYKPKNILNMGTTFIITPHVINTINSLPVEERIAITAALAGEMILGTDSTSSLTPVQEIIFSMIRQYVRRDTERFASTLGHANRNAGQYQDHPAL